MKIYRRSIKLSYVILSIITLITFAYKVFTESVNSRQSTELNKIVFVSERPRFSNKQIFIMDNNGSNQVKITDDSNEYMHPAFSPDDSEIILYSHTVNHEDEIYLVNLDGSDFIYLIVPDLIICPLLISMELK